MRSVCLTITSRLTKRARLTVAGLVLTCAAFFVAMPSGLAAAAINQCGWGSSQGNTWTCLSIGSTSVSTSATIASSGRVLESCLHYNGVRIACTGYTYLPRGTSIGFTYVPGGAVPSGTYCAVTWRMNPDGSTTEIDSECAGFGTTIIG